MSTWQDLVTASLIGTERSPVPPAGIPGVLTPDPASPGRDPAAILLDRAALLTAARRAGRRPDQAEPPPAAEPDPRPAVSRTAGRRLARMLGGEHPDLLAEWLTAATASGLRPPPQLLPALLDRARRGGSEDWDLPRLVAEAGGPRARWLAGLNAEWQFALAETTTGDEAWRLGTASQRRAYLTALRARDPGAARELVAASWASAGTAERVMFMKVMTRGLSLADEPLLEAARGGGPGSVSAMAADALMALPGSALSQRMAGVAVRRLRLEQDRRGPRLVLVPPTASDAAMQRDGITPGLDAAGPGLAPTGGMTFHIVARIPLRTWTQEFGLTAAQIVAVPAGEWAPSLFTAWSRAAVWQGDHDWMAALIGQALTGRSPRMAAEIQALDTLVRRADPALGAPDALPGPRPDAVPAVGAALRVLRFRYEMLKELAHDHGDG
ncbi:MAG: DUF5691 domain-containing protein [Streptosporangiaceae bacterium]